jgi:hypothetical protein
MPLSPGSAEKNSNYIKVYINLTPSPPIQEELY